MLISINWLRRHVDLDGVNISELIDRFLLSVAEVEGVTQVGQGLDTVLVGRVEEVAPIEGSRVQRTVVDLGPHGRQQIVCGAPNVAVGQLVPVAMPGTLLGELRIEVATVRGVESHGMIASERELGLGDANEGIMVISEVAELGTPLPSLWPVQDTIFEVDNKSLTHRPDLWGYRGIAREVAALLGRPLKPLNLELSLGTDVPIQIDVREPRACPRYVGLALDGVRVEPSPMWLKLLLHRVGTRAINNVVDLTNFVMLDLGNPLHAFDRREIKGDRIVVRYANEGESFTTLDERQHTLSKSDLLIADGEGGVALAGIMGGLDSEIQPDSESVLLEAANFDPAVVRRSAQRHGIRTDSSARFEKSLDPRLPVQAAKHFCVLLAELCPSLRVVSALMDECAELTDPPTVILRVGRVQARLGAPVRRDFIIETLRAIDFGVTELADDDRLEVVVPSFRATKDVSIEADLIEEIGRFYGYNNVVPTGAQITLATPHQSPRKRLERALRVAMSGVAGFDEVQTYSFAHAPTWKSLGAELDSRLDLANPISSELPSLRTALGPNLIGVLEKNNRNYDDIRVYELGRIFRFSEDAEIPEQPVTLGALAAIKSGTKGKGRELFFGLKGVLGSLARAIERRTLVLKQGGVEHPWAHPVRQARLLLDERPVGYLAEIHPRVLRDLGLGHEAALCEVDVDAWREASVAPLGYEPLPRFPAVFRDFAVLVPESVRAGEVCDVIVGATGEGMRAEVDFLSDYRGAGIPEGMKCLAWSVTLRHFERTLPDAEIKEFESQVWAALARDVQGRPRA